jgi:Flp pilus assembly protein TadD
LALRHGDFEEALARADRAYAIEPRNAVVVGAFGGALERRGARTCAEPLIEQLGTNNASGTPGGLVCYHLVRGDVDSAAIWFERAIAERDLRATWILPRMFGDLLISSRHWPTLAKAMKLPT